MAWGGGSSWTDVATGTVEKPVGADWEDSPPNWMRAPEVMRCMLNPAYFIDRYCSVYEAADLGAALLAADQVDADGEPINFDPTVGGGRYVRFHLWPAQLPVVDLVHKHNKVCILKARQLGMTWLCLAYALWTLLFRDGSTVLLFSRRDAEAMDMVRRLKEMFRRLPGWMVPANSFDSRGRLIGSSGHIWAWPNGSRVSGFPTGTGDSYSASLAIIDEADLVLKLDQQLASVKPTVDNGGKLVLLSKSNKAIPNSPFKNVYRGGRDGITSFKTVFLPWYARPERTQAWYDDVVKEARARTFADDWVAGEYPTTDEEALSANELDKRFPQAVVSPCFRTAVDLALGGKWPAIELELTEGGELLEPGDDGYTGEKVRKVVACPRIPGLRLYRLPEAGRVYTIGGDPAQGLPQSNDSAAVVVDNVTGEEVASFNGKITPKVFARYCAELSDWYSACFDAKCRVMVENNNHGQAFILWWRENRSEHDFHATLLTGPDRAVGWTQTGRSKETMYHRAAQRVADGRCVLHSRVLFSQVVSVEAESLEAPESSLDDLAVAWGLALAGADLRSGSGWKILPIGEKQGAA